jgi:hypothetical protein
MTPRGRRLVRSVAWRRHDFPGTEACWLRDNGADGWTIEGLAVVAIAGEPFGVSYEVACDRAFRSGRTMLSVRSGTGNVAVTLDVDEHGTWRAAKDGVEQGILNGPVDVDLGFTPSTNTLPIRRLDLGVGERAEVQAAWVRFPDLDVQRVPQRYTRLGGDRYRYESLSSGFAAELQVDDVGLVVAYGDIWERVATSTG